MRNLKALTLLSILAASTVAGGCSILYIPNVQQGNLISARALQQLQLGMTKDQVSYLLGTPPVRDPFHHDRWDYYFSFQKDGGPRTQQTLTLHFKDNRLVSMSGAVAPTPPV